MEISKTFTFEASHILPRHPGKCSRLHGHSFKLIVYVKGEVNPETGFVMDYGDIKEKVKPVIDELDHSHLGQWDQISHKWTSTALPLDFYPSSENLIMWIGEKLRCLLLMWSRLELDETCTSKCILTREEYEQAKGHVAR